MRILRHQSKHQINFKSNLVRLLDLLCFFLKVRPEKALDLDTKKINKSKNILPKYRFVSLTYSSIFFHKSVFIKTES